MRLDFLNDVGSASLRPDRNRRAFGRSEAPTAPGAGATRAFAIATLLATLGLAGCEASHPDAYVPVGHPANPQSAPGQRIGAPRALQPEIIDAEPAAAKPAG